MNYMIPKPPVGDVAHSYAFYLFSVPPSFSLPSQYTGLGSGDFFDDEGTLIGAETRAPFNVTQFLLDCGLDDDDLLARNHVRVRDLAGHPTQTFPPPRQATGSIENEVPEESAGSGSGSGTVQNQVATGGAEWKGEGSIMGMWAAMAMVSGALFVAM